jgi:hypothetical protein
MKRTELWLFWAAGVAVGMGVAFIILVLQSVWWVLLVAWALELALIAWSYVMYLAVTDAGKDHE